MTFQIQDLCRQACDADIRTAIAKLPRDLPQTYNRLLSRISSSGKEAIVENIFRWLAAAKRPLSVWELREAIAVRPEDEYLIRDRLVNNPDGVVNWCNNLVVMDEEEEIVQFAHHSVQQFLLSESSDTTTKRFHFRQTDADSQAGEICVTYLNFNDFERQLSSIPKNSYLIEPRNIAKAATTGSSRLAKYMIRVAERTSGLKRSSGAGLNMCHFEETSDSSKLKADDLIRDQYAFLAYASEFWWPHAANLCPGDSRGWTLWKQLLPAKNTLAIKPWITEKGDIDTAIVKRIIISENHCALAASVGDFGLAGDDFLNDLLTSIRGGKCRLVNALLHTGLNINARLPGLLEGLEGTPFALACACGNDEMVGLLLKKGFEGHAPTELFHPSGVPFRWAYRNGHSSTVKLLLKYQADVAAETTLVTNEGPEDEELISAHHQRGRAGL